MSGHEFDGDQLLGVPLADLQGKWIASGGTVVEVSGTSLSMNGFWRPLTLDSDGIRVLGYGVFQAICTDGAAGTVTWLAPGPMQTLWRRSDEDEIRTRTEQMNAHMHDRAAICGGLSFGVSTEAEIISRLNDLIEKWRQGTLVSVKSCDICPDWTNRAQTGLSVDHVHYIATRISTMGFMSRRRSLAGAHDVPVLVQETSDSELGGSALKKWREAASTVTGFPKFLLDGKTNFFCSLGNGHFSQALNLFRVGAQSLWSGNCYTVGTDEALREALDDGVESVVLSNAMPTDDRRFVAEMLNRSHGSRWRIGDDGRVSIDAPDQDSTQTEQFVALSKVLDAEELSCLVRRKLDVDAGGGAQGFLADMSHVLG